MPEQIREYQSHQSRIKMFIRNGFIGDIKRILFNKKLFTGQNFILIEKNTKTMAEF